MIELDTGTRQVPIFNIRIDEALREALRLQNELKADEEYRRMVRRIALGADH